MNLKNLLAMTAAALIVSAAPMSAALISVSLDTATETGAVAMIIAAPLSVGDNGTTGEGQLGFDEQQDYELTSAVTVDGGGSLAVGTVVDSHMIFLNSPTSIGQITHHNVTWTFDSDIIGIMSDQAGALEAASSGQLGAAGTDYTTGFPGGGFRGIELGTQPVGAVEDAIVFLDARTIRVNMFVTQPGDWIRVVTASPNDEIPEPGTVFLFGAGLLGAAFMRRRKKS